MALRGYLTYQFDINSPASELFDYCIEKMGLPKDDGTPEVEDVTVVIEGVPLKKKKISYKIEDFKISKWYEWLKASKPDFVGQWQNLNEYKKLEGTMTTSRHVVDNDRDRAILTINYTKISSDIEDPNLIMEAFVAFVQAADNYMYLFNPSN